MSPYSLAPLPEGLLEPLPLQARPTAGPRTGAAGVISPTVLTLRLRGLAGGFVARRQPTLTIGSRGAGCGGQHPPGRGDGGGVLLSAHDPHGLGGCPKENPAGVPPAPHRKSKPPREGVLSSQP